MKLTRTYPAPDEPQLTTHDRALSLYKYVLGLEPEDAIEHTSFYLVRALLKAREGRPCDDISRAMKVEKGEPHIVKAYSVENTSPELRKPSSIARIAPESRIV